MTVPGCCFFCGSFLLFMLRVCHAVLSVHCSLVVTCCERANLLAILCVMFSCVFVTFPCVVQGLMRYLIVSIPEFCFRPYSEAYNLFQNDIFSIDSQLCWSCFVTIAKLNVKFRPDLYTLIKQ